MRFAAMCFIVLTGGASIGAMDSLAVFRQSAEEATRIVEQSFLTCVFCDKTLSTKGHLRRHYKEIHVGQRYVCQHEGCARTYARRYVCLHHMQTSGHLKIFRCKIDKCAKTFNFYADLVKHEVQHDKKKWCESCQLCLSSLAYYRHKEKHAHQDNQSSVSNDNPVTNNLLATDMQMYNDILQNEQFNGESDDIGAFLTEIESSFLFDPCDILPYP